MEKLSWFKFTPSDWIMGKIQRCPEVTQARFMRLCCVYWNKDCNMTYEDAEVEIDKEHLDILISKRVLKSVDGIITITFLLEQIKEIEIDKIDKSQSGQIGNLKRWHRKLYDKFINNELSLNQAIEQSKISHPDSTPIAPQSQNIAEESKRREEKELEKKRKENIVDRKLKFSSTLQPFLNVYGKEFLNNFYRYWTEPNKSNTKFRQELEKTWDLERRLETWAKNDKNFKTTENGKQSNSNEPKIGRQPISTIEKNLQGWGNNNGN